MDIKSIIRPMERADKTEVIKMMRTFYASPAVMTNGSEEIFDADVEGCLSDSPYIEGYVFEECGNIQGYGMLAKSFSTEFGKPCIWIEDIYVKDEYRAHGIGSAFLRFVEEKYPDTVLRLEAEKENERALRVYKKFGFCEIPYMEMKK